MTRYCTKCGQPTQPERPNLFICTNKHQNFIDSVPAAGAYVVKDGKVLFGIRSSEPNPGGYNVPGGFLEIPESAEEAAIREVKEELGIDIRPVEIIGTYHTTYGEGGHDVLNILMVAEYVGGEVKPGDDISGGDPKWFDIGNMPGPDELSFPWQVQAQKDLKAWYDKHKLL